MRIQQCDICAETIQGTAIIVGKLWLGAELCSTCAKPILEFLEFHNLLKRARLEEYETQVMG